MWANHGRLAASHMHSLTTATTPSQLRAPARIGEAASELSRRLRELPAELGFRDGAELIAALQQEFATSVAPVLTPAAAAAAARRAKIVAMQAEFAVEAPTPEATIRAVVHRRLGPVTGYTAELRRRQEAEREDLCHALLSLFELGVKGGGGDELVVRELDVERVLAAMRRLFLVRGVSAKQVIGYCTIAADDGAQAHRLDPFQLRHVLTVHELASQDGLADLDLGKLLGALQRDDEAAVRDWFEEVSIGLSTLSKGATSRIKRLILEEALSHNSALEALVFEQAVLDVQMFGDLGWENSRLFYAQMARATGGAKSPFLVYMNAEEIEDAVIQCGKLPGMLDAKARFAVLHGTAAGATLRQNEKRVVDAAKVRTQTRTTAAVAV